MEDYRKSIQELKKVLSSRLGRKGGKTKVRAENPLLFRRLDAISRMNKRGKFQGWRQEISYRRLRLLEIWAGNALPIY
jgi:hypothetical protein